MLLVTIGTASLSIYLYIIVPKGFFPQQDTGRLQGNLQSAPNLSFTLSSPHLVQFMDILRTDPAVQSVAGSMNGTRGFGQNNIQPKPLAERKGSADQGNNRLPPQPKPP